MSLHYEKNNNSLEKETNREQVEKIRLLVSQLDEICKDTIALFAPRDLLGKLAGERLLLFLAILEYTVSLPTTQSKKAETPDPNIRRLSVAQITDILNFFFPTKMPLGADDVFSRLYFYNIKLRTSTANEDDLWMVTKKKQGMKKVFDGKKGARFDEAYAIATNIAQLTTITTLKSNSAPDKKNIVSEKHSVREVRKPALSDEEFASVVELEQNSPYFLPVDLNIQSGSLYDKQANKMFAGVSLSYSVGNPPPPLAKFVSHLLSDTPPDKMLSNSSFVSALFEKYQQDGALMIDFVLRKKYSPRKNEPAIKHIRVLIKK